VRLINLFVFFSLALAIAGCALPSDDDGRAKTKKRRALSKEALQKMLALDVRTMQATSSYDLNSYDKANKQVIAKVFGGTYGADLYNFYSTRIHHNLTEEEFENARLNVTSFRYTNWEIEVAASEEFRELADQPSAGGSGTVGAFNWGTLLWLKGLIDRVPIVVFAGDKKIPIESSRSGVMVFGPGYSDILETSEGNLPMPSEARNMFLLHEARHSDCTGGILDTDLEAARTATSLKHFLREFKRTSCGHLHTECTKGHLKGIIACDKGPWGAYAIGALYAEAVAQGMTGLNRAIMDAMIVDQRSRLQIPLSDMIDGKYGEPNMTSKGLISEHGDFQQ
jgi:hypothetical protein